MKRRISPRITAKSSPSKTSLLPQTFDELSRDQAIDRIRRLLSVEFEQKQSSHRKGSRARSSRKPAEGALSFTVDQLLALFEIQADELTEAGLPYEWVKAIEDKTSDRLF